MDFLKSCFIYAAVLTIGVVLFCIYLTYKSRRKSEQDDDEFRLLSRAREEGYERGLSEGKQEGYREGFEIGKEEGSRQGHTEAYKEAFNKGYSEGFEKGQQSV